MAWCRLTTIVCAFALLWCCSSVAGCTFPVGGSSVTVNLTGWDDLEFMLPDATNPDSFQYVLSLCKPVQSMPCAANAANMCQVSGGSSIFTLIYANKSPTPTWSPYKGDIKNGVVMSAANGDGYGCSPAGPRTVSVALVCDESAPFVPSSNASGASVLLQNYCSFNTTIRTAAVCISPNTTLPPTTTTTTSPPTPCPSTESDSATSGTNSDDMTKGIGIGVLIGVSVSVVVVCVVGFLIRRPLIAALRRAAGQPLQSAANSESNGWSRLEPNGNTLPLN